MIILYYQDLRKRVEAMEAKWAWAQPRVFGWVDSKGNVEIRHENKFVAIWRQEEELHEAELARLDAELDAIDSSRSPPTEPRASTRG